MTQHDVPTIETSTEINAAPAAVWSRISELKNMSRWSPQTQFSFVLGGGPTRPRSKLVNINRKGLLVWPTQTEVVRYRPEQEIAWRVKENYTIWSYTLEPTATGTKVTARREAPQGLSTLSVKLTNTALGGVDEFGDELRRDMDTTLAKIKADVEA